MAVLSFDIGIELGCSFSLVPHLANPVVDLLAKIEAECLVSFVGKFFLP